MSSVEYRGYVISREPMYSNYVIKYDGKGSIADMLSGYFQKVDIAKLTIDRYLEDKKPEKKSVVLS